MSVTQFENGPRQKNALARSLLIDIQETIRAQLCIPRRQLHADTFPTRQHCRVGRGATAKKWVKNRSAGFDDLHQILHQCQRFARDMHLGSRVDRAVDDAGETSAGVMRGLPLAGVYNEFRIPPEFSNHRPGTRLVPDHDTAPHPPRRLYGVRLVGNCRQSVKTSKGAPSRATRQHSESHIVAQVK